MASADFPTRVGISRDKQTCFRCIHAGCTQSRVMGTRFQTDRRPNLSLRASYPVSVRHVASVTKASSRPVLTHSPLPSYIGPVPKTEGDLHPRATSHARRTYTRRLEHARPRTRQVKAPYRTQATRMEWQRDFLLSLPSFSPFRPSHHSPHSDASHAVNIQAT